MGSPFGVRASGADSSMRAGSCRWPSTPDCRIEISRWAKHVVGPGCLARDGGSTPPASTVRCPRVSPSFANTNAVVASVCDVQDWFVRPRPPQTSHRSIGRLGPCGIFPAATLRCPGHGRPGGRQTPAPSTDAGRQTWALVRSTRGTRCRGKHSDKGETGNENQRPKRRLGRFCRKKEEWRRGGDSNPRYGF